MEFRPRGHSHAHWQDLEIIVDSLFAARIHTIGDYSVHADQNDLLALIQGILQAPKDIRLIHGDRDVRQSLKARIGSWAESNVHSVEVTLAA